MYLSGLFFDKILPLFVLNSVYFCKVISLYKPVKMPKLYLTASKKPPFCIQLGDFNPQFVPNSRNFSPFLYLTGKILLPLFVLNIPGLYLTEPRIVLNKIPFCTLLTPNLYLHLTRNVFNCLCKSPQGAGFRLSKI